MKSVTRTLYFLVLLMAFLCAILMSFLQVLKEQTTFEEKILKKRGTLPSLTICEFHYENNQKYKTLQDVMDSIEEKKQNIINFFVVIVAGFH